MCWLHPSNKNISAAQKKRARYDLARFYLTAPNTVLVFYTLQPAFIKAGK
jgi:hypothetical protein